jgi:hypothetical protein
LLLKRKRLSDKLDEEIKIESKKKKKRDKNYLQKKII